MDRETLFEALKTNLRSMTLNEVVAQFITKTQAMEDFYKLCNGISAGKTISLLFNPHRLSTDTEKDDISIFESFQYDDKLSGLARLYLYNLEHGTNNAFYNTIQRGYQNIQYVNEFPPIVARNIYKRYCKKSFEILDPCAGWGGRMIGCASLPNTTYTAFEPCTKTWEGLNKLGEWLKLMQPKFKYQVYHLPYEDKPDLGKKFDMALTSPPYYDTEHYSDEGTNSLNRYKTFDDWVEGFYKPLILSTIELLKDDGVFVINVGSRKYPLESKLYEICEDNKLCCARITDYLSGNGEGKEKFFCISKHPTVMKNKKLF